MSTRHFRDMLQYACGGDNQAMTRATDPRLSFDAAAAIYDEIRPRYPAAMFDDLFRLLLPGPVVLEVGPGTGQATRDLLDRGAVVHAVEIGPAMAAKLHANLPSDNLRVSVAYFERLDIPAPTVA